MYISVHFDTFRIMDFLDLLFWHTQTTFPLPIKQLQSRDLWWDTHELLNTGSSRPGRGRHHGVHVGCLPWFINSHRSWNQEKHMSFFGGWWCWFSETWRCFVPKKYMVDTYLDFLVIWKQGGFIMIQLKRCFCWCVEAPGSTSQMVVSYVLSYFLDNSKSSHKSAIVISQNFRLVSTSKTIKCKLIR